MIVLVANLPIYLKPWESLCTYKSLGGCNCAPCAERDFPQGTQNFFTTKFAAQQLLFSSLPCCVFFFFFFSASVTRIGIRDGGGNPSMVTVLTENTLGAGGRADFKTSPSSWTRGDGAPHSTKKAGFSSPGCAAKWLFSRPPPPSWGGFQYSGLTVFLHHFILNF